MREIREILNTLNKLEDSDLAVLATVVDVKGSSFRLPGAKMLILVDGTTVGTVSGGCLEADVLERADSVRESGKPSLFVYDTTDEEDSVFSLNMGCRGIVSILMEKAAGSPVIGFFEDNLKNSREGVIATLIEGEGLGSQVIVDSAGLRHSSFERPEHTQAVLAEADEILSNRSSNLVVTKAGNVFFEYIPVPTIVTIFGAGADAVPLSKAAFELGWKIHIIDHRPAFANKKRFPLAESISTTARENLGLGLSIRPDSIGVVMTHNFENDKLIMSRLVQTDIGYIGQMGPKSRTERMLEEIEASGISVPEETREKIHGPVGLDIGATTPEGIALSIVAEIQTFLSGRTGGYLREREGSIYGRG